MLFLVILIEKERQPKKSNRLHKKLLCLIKTANFHHFTNEGKTSSQQCRNKDFSIPD